MIFRKPHRVVRTTQESGTRRLLKLRCSKRSGADHVESLTINDPEALRDAAVASLLRRRTRWWRGSAIAPPMP